MAVPLRPPVVKTNTSMAAVKEAAKAVEAAKEPVKARERQKKVPSRAEAAHHAREPQTCDLRLFAAPRVSRSGTNSPLSASGR